MVECVERGIFCQFDQSFSQIITFSLAKYVKSDELCVRQSGAELISANFYLLSMRQNWIYIKWMLKCAHLHMQYSNTCLFFKRHVRKQEGGYLLLHIYINFGKILLLFSREKNISLVMKHLANILFIVLVNKLLILIFILSDVGVMYTIPWIRLGQT